MTDENNPAVDACQTQAAKEAEEERIDVGELVYHGERVAAAERANLVADGVVMPVAPGDVEHRRPDERPESDEEINFTDPETIDEEHGRGLV